MKPAGAILSPSAELVALQQAISPPRPGPRPRMSDMLPHIQLDQWPPGVLVSRMVAQAAQLPEVTLRESRMAAPGSLAVALADEFALGPAAAFIDLSEFCYLHAAPHGGMHLTLPPQAGALVSDHCWGELHPAARAGLVSPCLMAVYAPRNEREAAVALALLNVSWRFARGIW